LVVKRLVTIYFRCLVELSFDLFGLYERLYLREIKEDIESKKVVEGWRGV
jgi:hypothetical protein